MKQTVEPGVVRAGRRPGLLSQLEETTMNTSDQTEVTGSVPGTLTADATGGTPILSDTPLRISGEQADRLLRASRWQ
ncbi:MAG: hypothetical protein KY460_03845 [Actinobacteria bacterium]|nr:hypothetical protein [Actinomycetota bacterium]